MKSKFFAFAICRVAAIVALLASPTLKAEDATNDAAAQLRAVLSRGDSNVSATDALAQVRELLAALGIKVDNAELLAALEKLKAQLETTVPAAAASEDTTEDITEKSAVTGGVETNAVATSKLQPSSSLQSGGRGLSSVKDWRRVFPRKTP